MQVFTPYLTYKYQWLLAQDNMVPNKDGCHGHQSAKHTTVILGRVAIDYPLYLVQSPDGEWEWLDSRIILFCRSLQLVTEPCYGLCSTMCSLPVPPLYRVHSTLLVHSSQMLHVEFSTSA